MKWSVALSQAAEKEFASLSREMKKRVAQKVNALCEDPFAVGWRRLQNARGLFRVRVGDLRIVYKVSSEEHSVLIVRIADRGEVYRKLDRL